MISKISLVAVESFSQSKVFVRVPNENGRWVLTDKVVVYAPCGVCGAMIGEPCKNPKSGVYWAGTHADRRSSYRYKGISKPHYRTEPAVAVQEPSEAWEVLMKKWQELPTPYYPENPFEGDMAKNKNGKLEIYIRGKWVE